MKKILSAISDFRLPTVNDGQNRCMNRVRMFRMMLITIISYRGANTTKKLNGKRKKCPTYDKFNAGYD